MSDLKSAIQMLIQKDAEHRARLHGNHAVYCGHSCLLPNYENNWRAVLSAIEAGSFDAIPKGVDAVLRREGVLDELHRLLRELEGHRKSFVAEMLPLDFTKQMFVESIARMIQGRIPVDLMGSKELQREIEMVAGLLSRAMESSYEWAQNVRHLERGVMTSKEQDAYLGSLDLIWATLGGVTKPEKAAVPG